MIEIKKGYEIKTPEEYNLLIYACPSFGKTTLASTASSPLLLDLDGGVHRVSGSLRPDTIVPQSYEDILELVESSALDGYKTIVIDTFGKFLSFMDSYIANQHSGYKKTDGELSLQGYGARKKAFMKLLQRMIEKRKNLIFLAHDVEEKDVDGNIIIRPLASGSSTADLMSCMDLVAYGELKGNTRILNFTPTDKFHTKNYLKLPDQIIVPDEKDLKDFLKNTIETEIYARRKAEAALVAEKTGEWQEWEQKIRYNFAHLNRPVDWNKEMFAEAKKMKNNKQFAALVFKIAKEEAEKEGVVWNAEKRSFETPTKEETK